MKETQLYFLFYYGFIIDDVIRDIAPIYQRYLVNGGLDLSKLFDNCDTLDKEIDNNLVIPMDFVKSS